MKKVLYLKDGKKIIVIERKDGVLVDIGKKILPLPYTLEQAIVFISMLGILR